MIRIVLAIFLVFASVAVAKRIGPAEVKPINFEGITYSVPPFINDDSKQNGGFLEARDSKGQLLWRVQIYKTIYNPILEQDVQDIFITTLSLDKLHKFLLMSDEKQRTFAVDLSTKKVSRLK